MKKKATILILFVLLFVQAYSGGKKIALIIAIGDYPKESGWSKISSNNDVSLLKPALLYQGFAESDISIITNSQATKVGILAGLKQLNKSAYSGDIIYIHFSCHGQLIFDQDGDELDGYDEALISFDAPKYYESDPTKGKNHFRDDEFRVELDKIRKKVGKQGNVLVVLDACHSGTATRGIGISRGTEIKFCSSDYHPDSLNTTKDSFFEFIDRYDLSPIIVFSASGASEQNNEYKNDSENFGSLSYAISKAFYQLNPQISYRGLFGNIQNTMSSIVPGQTPQLEGKSDILVFGGNAVKQEKFIRVKFWRDKHTIILDAGQLNGIYPNTIIELFPVGTITTSSTKAIATGKVISSNMTESAVSFEVEIDKTIALNSWVFFKEMSISGLTIPIKFSSNFNTELKKNLISKFEAIDFIKIVDKEPELLFESDINNHYKLLAFTKNGQKIFDCEFNATNVNSLLEDLFMTTLIYGQGKLLRSIEAESQEYNLSFELIPVTLSDNKEIITHYPPSSKRNPFGQTQFSPGDLFKIRITNHGSKDAYYSIVDIQPDNIINILIPEKDDYGRPYRAPVDCKISAGKSEELKTVFYISEPFGQEIFKLIASPTPLYLDQILDTRGSSQNQSTPFEAFFAESLNPSTRGNSAFLLPKETIGITTLVFKIVPKE